MNVRTSRELTAHIVGSSTFTEPGGAPASSSRFSLLKSHRITTRGEPWTVAIS